jgi:outer membrane protein assembly factor BamD
MKQNLNNLPSTTASEGLSVVKRLFRLCLLPLVYGILMFTSSCETPEKVLKSTDLDYKKAKAISWYNKKEYFKCIPILEELIGLLKGRESTEEFYYMYAMANYKQGDYLIAAYHFKNFYDLYPNSTHAEECLYMFAKSNLMQSPKPDLDQTFTYKALEAYTLFLNSYSDGHYIVECNEAVKKLRRKLEKKALNAAELYYKTENYKAAATSFEQILKDFPDIEENERISFMIVKSNFKFAQNSIPSKKMDRFNGVIKAYADFKYKFATSKYIEEAKKYEQQSHYLAAISAFEWAEIAGLLDRERLFRVYFKEAKIQTPFLIEKKQIDELTKLTERAYFLIVKNNFAISEEKKSTERLPWLEQTVKTYYNFVDQFPKSRYSAEAERIFNNSTELIKKLKTNG